MGLTRITAQQISDIDYKQAVRVITLTNITLSGGAPSSVDDVNLVTDDRVLVAGQTTGSQNGLYRVQTVGAGSNGTWVRTSDGNETGEIEAGMIVMVTEGTSYADTQWKLITNNPIVIGTTALEFEQSSAYSFGTITANAVGIVADTVGDTVTFTPGDNFVISGNAATDTITFGVSQSPTFTGDVTIGGNLVGSITVDGNVLPLEDNVYNLGSPDRRWQSIYVGANTIDIGGATISADLVTGSLILTGPDGAEFILTGSDALNAEGAFGFVSAGNAAAATSTTTGALQVVGGAGIGGNIYAGGLINATGNVTGGNLTTAGQVVATGNVTGGNIVTAGDVTTATITASGAISSGSTITATGNVSGSNITTAGDVTTATVTATQTITGGNVAIRDRGILYLYDTDSSNYIGHRAPGTLSGNFTYQWPTGYGNNTQVLTTNGAGGLTWEDAGSGGGSGTSSYPNSTVTPVPGATGNFDLSYNFAQTVQETPFEAAGTDAFGVNLGEVYSMMDPVGDVLDPVDLGVLT